MDLPAPPPLVVISDGLTERERRALTLIRQLLSEKKPVILLLDETGAIRVYRGERAGIVPPP